MRICTFESCDREMRANSLCVGHNRQRSRGQELRPLEARRKFGSFVPCSFEGCPKDTRVKGVCEGHYQQIQRGEALRPLLSVVNGWDRSGSRLCEFPDCGRPHESKGLCASHYSQFYSIPRRADRIRSARGHATPKQIADRIAFYGGLCAYCGDPYEHVDHVIPLARGGTNWPANRVPACGPCNWSKNASDPTPWVEKLRTSEFTDPVTAYVASLPS